MIYRWKIGTVLKADAQIAGEVLEGLAAESRLTPAELVEVSRPETAPLHGEFEWDDAKAAATYREIQARYIIRHVEIAPEKENDPPVRAFVRADPGQKKSYEPIDVVMSDADKKEYLLAQARRDMIAFVRKYKALEALRPVVSAAENFLRNKKEEKTMANEHFGECLKHARTYKMISQNRLAAEAGMTQGTISNYEAGRVVPTEESARKLAAAMGLVLKETDGDYYFAFPDSERLTETQLRIIDTESDADGAEKGRRGEQCGRRRGYHDGGDTVGRDSMAYGRP